MPTILLTDIVLCHVHRLDEDKRQNPELNESLNLQAKLLSDLNYFQSASFPPTEVDIGPHLIGTTIKFLGVDTDEIMECTVKDYGTSQLQGDWVDVVYGDARESRISREEMYEILENRV
jgi:hypothetical protein